MLSRRAVLGALTALGGCANRDVVPPTGTPTATPPQTPTPHPVPEEVEEAIANAELEDGPVCPATVPCFHRLSRHDDLETVVVPSRERIGPEHPEATLITYNFGTEPLVLGSPAWTGKWTDIHWVPTVGPDVPDDVRVVESGESLERTVRYDGGGDGIYALVEAGYFGDPREPPTVRPDGKPARLRGETFRFGAIFEVEGSEWELAGDPDVPTERRGDTLVVHPERDGEETFLVEAADKSEGLPLVEESVAAHPPTKRAILALRRDGVERVRMPTDGTAWWYLWHAMVFPQDVEDDQALRLADVVFHARAE